MLLLAAVLAAAAPAHTATARYGNAELQLHKGDLAFVRAPGATPRVLTRQLPAAAASPALGLDATGRLTALVAGRGGLYETAISRPGRLVHVTGTTSSDSLPGLFRGRLAYAHGSAVQTRALAGGSPRAVWRKAGWFPLAVAPGAGNATAFVAGRDGAGNGAFQLLLARPGQPVKRLLYLPLGDTHSGRLTIDGIDTAGHELRVTRELDGAVSHRSFSL
ncbi:hypothetical protein [Solirubrobacter soli]|uniref:hypothetical protein n=1 Tax=Solirubrobacter soli TaxID=363832 RepID=UPI0012F7D93D|nr:hypothetical protein [Solirubrobacter soli]